MPRSRTTAGAAGGHALEDRADLRGGVVGGHHDRLVVARASRRRSVGRPGVDRLGQHPDRAPRRTQPGQDVQLRRRAGQQSGTAAGQRALHPGDGRGAGPAGTGQAEQDRHRDLAGGDLGGQTGDPADREHDVRRSGRPGLGDLVREGGGLVRFEAGPVHDVDVVTKGGERVRQPGAGAVLVGRQREEKSDLHGDALDLRGRAECHARTCGAPVCYSAHMKV